MISMRKASEIALTLAQQQVVAAGTAIALDRASDQDKAFLARPTGADHVATP